MEIASEVRGDLNDSHPRLWLTLCDLILCGLLASCTSKAPATSVSPLAPSPLSASSSPSAQAGKSELVICTTNQPDSLLNSNQPVSAMVRGAVAPTAVQFGQDYVAKPLLVRALPSPSDGTLTRNEDGTLEVVLNYRDDLKWSDGEPFKAADAVLGFEWYGKVNTGSIVDAKESGPLSVTLMLPADAPYPYVPEAPPLPSHKLQGVDLSTLASTDFGRLMTPSLGYYTVSAWTAGQDIELQANPNHTPPAKIPTVRVHVVSDGAALAQGMASGQCDVEADDGLDPSQVKLSQSSQPGGAAQVATLLGHVQERLLFNTFTGDTGRTPYLADVRVRQAIAFALDRAALAALIEPDGHASVLDSWLPPDHWAYSANGLAEYPVSLDRSKSLLDQAGWSDQNSQGARVFVGAGGPYSCQRGDWKIDPKTPLSPTLLIPAGDSLRAQEAGAIKSSLAQVGIALTVQPVDPSVLFAQDGPLVRRQFDMALLSAVISPEPGGIESWVGADVYRHPLDKTLVHRWQLEDRWLTTDQLVERVASSNIPSDSNDYQGQDFSGWCNEQADLDIVQANVALNIQDRLSAYAKQQVLFTQDVPVLPLAMRPRSFIRQASLCGLHAGPYAPITWNIGEWSYDSTGKCP